MKTTNIIAIIGIILLVFVIWYFRRVRKKELTKQQQREVLKKAFRAYGAVVIGTALGTAIYDKLVKNNGPKEKEVSR